MLAPTYLYDWPTQTSKTLSKVNILDLAKDQKGKKLVNEVNIFMGRIVLILNSINIEK